MTHPFQWLPEGSSSVILGITFVGTVVLMVVLSQQGKPLNTPTLPRGILAYEFAWNADRVNEIKGLWKAEIETAQKQIRLDFLFLLVYPVFFSLACAKLSESPLGAMASVGVFISWAVLAAAPLDAVENWALLRMLTHPATDQLARLAGYCAGLKFVLVFSALGYIILEGLATSVAYLRPA